MIGYKYETFIAKELNRQIFDDIIDNVEKTYIHSTKRGTIAKSKLDEIKKGYDEIVRMNEQVRREQSEAIDIIPIIQNFLNLIEVMNATSVIGTIDFADEISKYNLNYNKCSIVQPNINYSKTDLLSDDFYYIREDKKHINFFHMCSNSTDDKCDRSQLIVKGLDDMIDKTIFTSSKSKLYWKKLFKTAIKGLFFKDKDYVLNEAKIRCQIMNQQVFI